MVFIHSAMSSNKQCHYSATFRRKVVLAVELPSKVQAGRDFGVDEKKCQSLEDATGEDICVRRNENGIHRITRRPSTRNEDGIGQFRSDVVSSCPSSNDRCAPSKSNGAVKETRRIAGTLQSQPRLATEIHEALRLQPPWSHLNRPEVAQ